MGAAISIWPNGVKCMQHLGMGEIIETYGGPMRSMAYQEYRSGAIMTRFSLAPLIERVAGRPCPVSRAELQREMLDFWGRDRVQFGKRVTEAQEDADGVTVRFGDGSSARGDVLIAADGSRSALRPAVLGYAPERRYAGYVNWNGLVEIDEAIAPADQWTTFVGEGKRVSLMPVADGRFYFFFDVPLPAGLAEDRSTLRADLRRYFSGWAPQVQRLIAALDPATTNRIEIHDIEPFERLTRGRIALLGMPPTAPRRISARAAALPWRTRWCLATRSAPTAISPQRCSSTKAGAANGCAIWCSRRVSAAILPTAKIWR